MSHRPSEESFGTFSLTSGSGGARGSTSSSRPTQKQREILILSDKDVNKILIGLKMNDLYKLCKKLHVSLSQLDIIEQPERLTVETPYDSTAMYMPAYGPGWSALKSITIPKAAPINGSILLQHKSGHPRALINAAEATAFRTALGSITVLLARKHVPELSEPRDIAVFGAGKQAEWAIRLAVLAFPTVEKVNLSNRSPDRATHLANMLTTEMPNSPGIAVHAWSPGPAFDQIVAGSDLVFCCTPSTTPLFSPDALFAGKTPKFVSLIGSYKPTMHELDFKPLKGRKDVVFIVDTVDGVLSESGEIIDAQIPPRDLRPLSSLSLDDGEGDNSIRDAWCTRFRKATVVYKSVGCGVMDLAIAEGLVLLARPSERKPGVGMAVPF